MIRTVLFYLALVPVTIGFGVSLLAGMLLMGPVARYNFSKYWAAYLVHSLRVICGVRWEIRGEVPLSAAVCLSRHESVWETIAYHVLLPRTSMVAKRSLAYIPFFNILMWQCRPITIARNGSLQEMLRIRRAGQARLHEGYGMVVFPEGTRMKPNCDKKHYLGGALLAKSVARPIYFINLNSGNCWPKNSWIIAPGLITVLITSAPAGINLSARALADNFAAWVKKTRPELTAPHS